MLRSGHARLAATLRVIGEAIGRLSVPGTDPSPALRRLIVVQLATTSISRPNTSAKVKMTAGKCPRRYAAMMRAALITLLAVGAAHAQQVTRPVDALSRVTTDSLPTPAEAASLAVKRNITSGSAIVRLVGLTTLGQALQLPQIWPRTIQGYGQRAVLTLGTNLSRDAVLTGVATALGHDARYQRCECEGFATRTTFALSGVLRHADSNGKLRVDPAALLAALAAGYASTALSGQSITRNRVAQASAGQLLQIAVGQVALEFRPDIRRWFRRHDSTSTGADRRAR